MNKDEIKKAAFDFVKSEDDVTPDFQNDAEKLLFLQMANIYSLYINKVISKHKAVILTADAVKDFDMNEFYRAVYEESLDNRRRCEDLMIKMNKEPSIKTALEIIYALLPPLSLQKDKIERALMK